MAENEHSHIDIQDLNKLNLDQTLDIVKQLHQTLTCSICQDIMYCPCVTTCGHTYCYNCLFEWFKSRDHNKTCPNCRKKVRSPPVMSLQLRNLALVTIGSIVKASPEKKKGFEEAEKEAMRSYNEDLEMHNETFPTLFDGTRERVIDKEDGVSRCPFCNWEVHENYCDHCMRYFDGDMESDRGEEEHDSQPEDSEGPNEYEDDGFVVPDDDAEDIGGPVEDHSYIDEHVADDSSTEGGEDDTYDTSREMVYRETHDDEDSDDEDRPRQRQGARRARQIVMLSDDDDDDEEEVEEEDDGSLIARGPYSRPRPIVSVSDDDDEDDDDDDIHVTRHSGQHRMMNTYHQIDDDEEDDHDDSISYWETGQAHADLNTSDVEVRLSDSDEGMGGDSMDEDGSSFEGFSN